jgi:hypothetical protein
MAVLDTAGPPRPSTPFFLTHRLLKQGVDHPVKPGDDGVGESLAKTPGITTSYPLCGRTRKAETSQICFLKLANKVGGSRDFRKHGEHVLGYDKILRFNVRHDDQFIARHDRSFGIKDDLAA